jgi:hypothetical protein
MAAPVVTNKYASSMAGGRSADIQVGQGESVTVYVWASDLSALPENFQARVLRKVGTGYRQMPDSKDIPAILTESRWEVVLTAPGTYAVLVPPTQENVTVTEER